VAADPKHFTASGVGQVTAPTDGIHGPKDELPPGKPLELPDPEKIEAAAELG
jgi:hypothetical protein